ncbi:MAG TPA: dihydropyrimidinase, partial [Cupriavidus sp.]|nr:dihydropyrimidinase [Cupriavidus sp.]
MPADNNLDLVIRNADVVTASDRYRCDIGVRGGRIVALGHDLPPAASEVDATGLLALPGGVDGHCH